MGTYSVLASVAGNTDCSNATTSTIFTVGSGTPTLNMTINDGTLNGSALAAVETVAGVGSQSKAVATLESVFPSLISYWGTSLALET